MRGYIPDEALEFLKRLMRRQPVDRVTANEALSDPIFFKEVYDEGSQILSNKLMGLGMPKIIPLLKGEKDDQQTKIHFSNNLNSSHLKSAYFRYENSKNHSGASYGYNSPSFKRSILDTKFGSYRGFSNASIRNNNSLVIPSRPGSVKKKQPPKDARSVSQSIKVSLEHSFSPLNSKNLKKLRIFFSPYKFFPYNFPLTNVS